MNLIENRGAQADLFNKTEGSRRIAMADTQEKQRNKKAAMSLSPQQYFKAVATSVHRSQTSLGIATGQSSRGTLRRIHYHED